MENSDKLRLIMFSDLHYAQELPVNNGSNIDRKLIQYSIPLINQLIQNINYSLKRDIENLNFIWNVLKNINNDEIPDGVYFEVEIDNKRLNIKEKHLVL